MIFIGRMELTVQVFFMDRKALPEVWLRGPVPGIPALLQPVAHALMQAREEVRTLMEEFPEEYLWQRPAGVASPGFHLQHLAGVLDRLFTYAAGNPLSREQLAQLAAEGTPGPERTSDAGRTPGTNGPSIRDLTDRFDRQVDKALDQLKQTPEDTLTTARGVGRAQLPSTVLGLLVHAAEHTQRHTGQLLVTVRVLFPKISLQATP
jgi:hypothetical protein